MLNESPHQGYVDVPGPIKRQTSNTFIPLNSPGLQAYGVLDPKQKQCKPSVCILSSAYSGPPGPNDRRAKTDPGTVQGVESAKRLHKSRVASGQATLFKTTIVGMHGRVRYGQTQHFPCCARKACSNEHFSPPPTRRGEVKSVSLRFFARTDSVKRPPPPTYG